jgi:hypothetical protein
MILEQLARGMGNSKSSCDVHVLSARHGDFMCGTEGDLGGGSGGTTGSFLQCIGLYSSRLVRESIQALALAYCKTALGIDADVYQSKVGELVEKGIIDVKQIDETLPSKRDNVPYFLR